MASEKVSEMTTATALDGTELVPVIQDGSNKKTTTQDIADLGIGGSTGSVDNAILRADGTGGNTAKSSQATITDAGVMYIPGSSTNAAEIRLGEDSDNGSNYIGLKPAASVTNSITYTLPEAPSVSGLVISSTTGGVMSWVEKAIQTTITIPPAQVLTSGTTPVELVAAPGSGFIIEVISCSAVLVYNSTPYATNTSYQIRIGTAGLFNAVNLLGNPGTRYSYPVRGALLGDYENQNINFVTIGGNPTAGDSEVNVNLTYRILTL